MAKPTIIDKRPMSIAEVKDVIKKVHERDGELSFRAGKTEEYVNDTAALSKTKSKELVKKIQGLEIPRLKDHQILKIVDLMPQSQEQLKVLLSGFNITVSKDNLKKIMDVVEDYLPVN
ncbi:MAG: hypothetical protein ACLFTH_02650 [Candidatus Woesearchaeota archaeon]